VETSCKSARRSSLLKGSDLLNRYAEESLVIAAAKEVKNMVEAFEFCNRSL